MGATDVKVMPTESAGLQLMLERPDMAGPPPPPVWTRGPSPPTNGVVESTGGVLPLKGDGEGPDDCIVGTARLPEAPADPEGAAHPALVTDEKKDEAEDGAGEEEDGGSRGSRCWKDPPPEEGGGGDGEWAAGLRPEVTWGRRRAPPDRWGAALWGAMPSRDRNTHSGE